MLKIVGMVVCTNRIVKMKEHLKFVVNSAYFVLKTKLVLTVLPNTEKDVALKESTF